MRTMTTIIELPRPLKDRNLPRRKKNRDLRVREHLTEDEVFRLIDAAKSVGRHTHRDATLILTCYRHGLRVSELVNLQWDQVDLKRANMQVNRLKRGTPSNQPIRGDEMRWLRKLQRLYPNSPFVFVSELGGPLTPDAVQWIIKRAGKTANFGFQVHPHMLRHACGQTLANEGTDTRAIQGYLGHNNIQHTVRYTELAEGRYKDFFKNKRRV
jgi:type 1 fimbriae regulatory protein FimE